MEKTNVMRILDQHKIEYASHTYVDTNAISGVEVANVLNQNPLQVFKTLVTKGGNHYYVFLLPVEKSLNLKKAAKVVKEKSVEMIKMKDLFSLTGYVHGGCSPLGMKKTFPTFIDISAKEFDTIIFSGGKIGYQVELSLSNLQKVLKFELVDLVE